MVVTLISVLFYSVQGQSLSFESLADYQRHSHWTVCETLDTVVPKR